jgi:DeoR family fructose operon transcriptional repressor
VDTGTPERMSAGGDDQLPGEFVTRSAISGGRLRSIADIVNRDGSVRASELVERFAVTDETVRRDLKRLEAMGVVQRVHGGAVAAGGLGETTYAGRLLKHEAEKRAIANFASRFVRDGDTLIVDAGTTTMYLIRELRGKRDLIVATNAVTHAAELAKNPHVTLMLIGGVVRPATFAAVGDMTIAALREIHVERTFLAAHSLSARSGITNPIPEEVPTKRAMIAAASEVILLVDHSKFGEESLIKVAPLSSVGLIVTSELADPDEIDRIRSLGVEVTQVPVDDTSNVSSPPHDGIAGSAMTVIG